MAIQISEKKLSPKAQKALSNAKNKSQFLRDAIEHYVSKDIPQITNDPELKEDIKEIKEFLMKIASQKTSNDEVAFTQETFASSQKEIKAEKNLSENKKENQAVENRDLKIEEDSTEKNEKANISEDGYTEEQKREIEEMLVNSIDNFF